MEIIYHADDFGITPEQSARILACSSACGGEGALNSLSILVNAPRFAECADLLDECEQRLLTSLHFNVVEGICCADPALIPSLVDEQGMFNRGFAGLLLASLGDTRKELRAQLEIEAGAQLDAYLDRFPSARKHLRLDSHQHFHLIPVVWDALLTAARSRECVIEFVRIPAEPIIPFLQTPQMLFKVPPVNWVKHWLLNFLWRFRKKQATREGITQRSAVFCGINFSGCMDPDRVQAVLPAFERYAAKRGKTLELLFHPGGYQNPSDALNPALDGFVAFYTSPNRDAEASALRLLGVNYS